MRPASGVLGQLEVLHALVLRETRTRFGKHQLGYLWALVEPLLWIGMFAGMMYLMNRPAPNGMEMVAFLTTGLVPFLLWRHTTDRAVTAVGANRALLFYPQIQPLDLVGARALLEFATMVVVFAVLITGAHLLEGTSLEVDQWLVFLFALFATSALGVGLGLVFAALSVFTPAVERLASPLTRPVFWISGLFFTANGLPPGVRHVFLYNPLLHCLEFARSGWFHEYESRYASYSYVILWIVTLLFFGLTLERVARRRLEVA